MESLNEYIGIVVIHKHVKCDDWCLVYEALHLYAGLLIFEIDYEYKRREK